MGRLLSFVIAFLVISTLGSTTVFGESEGDAPKTITKKLIVGTKVVPPFVIKKADGSLDGISIDLWSSIASELGYEYEYKEYDLASLLAAVENGDVDIAVAALTLTPEREKRFDFTHSFFNSGLGIAVRKRAGNPWLAVATRFLSPAFLKVIGGLTLLLFVVGVLVWLFERKANSEQFGGSVLHGIGSGFWWSAVTMTTVGYGDKSPVSFFGRFLGLIWMFAGIIMISGFTAAITSTLTVSAITSLVSGAEDLPRVRVGSIANTTGEEYLSQRRIVSHSYSTVTESLEDLGFGLIDAVVYDAPLLRYHVRIDYSDDLEVLSESLRMQDYGFALPDRSPLRESINLVLLEKIRDPGWQRTLTKYLGS